ncbi:condensation domain-containing protein [Streptomyces xiangluensis]|uniref:Condensation domain-containing protein n=1 Tax=Streptomyces xiangluensis TaxID=2665720 RepID=A0ABV8YLL3_9ACTN
MTYAAEDPTRPNAVPATHSAADTEQLEIWLAGQRDAETDRFNVPVHLEIRGVVDEAALRLALADVVARHPALRSAFVADGGELRRATYPTAEVPLRVHPQRRPYQRAEALGPAVRAVSRPLDVATAPLLRADLFRYETGAALLSLTTHHIVCDGWSLDLLANDVTEAYAARLAGRTPDLGIPAPDIDTDAHADSDTYWSDLLRGEAAWLAPLPDLVAQQVTPGPSAHREITLSREAVAGLRTLVAHQKATSAVVVLAAWTLLLHGWSAVDDGVLGMPFGGRGNTAAQREVGLYTRVLPIRSLYRPEQPFNAYLDKMREQVLDSLAHPVVSTESLRTSLAALTGGPAAPATVFVHRLENTTTRRVEEGSVKVVEHPTDTAKYPLTLCLIECSDGLRLWADYDSSVYRAATIDLLLRQLATLLIAVAESPTSSCQKLIAQLVGPPSTTDDASATLSVSAPPSTATPPETLPERVADQAEQNMAATALKCGRQTWTYGNVMAQAVAAAAVLHDHGVAPNDVVALRLPAGRDAIVSTVAIVLAGASYVHLGPDPAASERLLHSCGARAIIVQGEAETAPHAAGARVIDVSELMTAPPDGTSDTDLPVRHAPNAGMMARCRLTSDGSVQRQVFSHGALAAVVGDTGLFDVGPADVIAQWALPESSIFAYEIWGALAHGAQLAVMRPQHPPSYTDLRSELRRHGVSVLLLTTEQFCDLIDEAPDTLQSLRRVCVFGEPLPVRQARRALQWCGEGVIRYGYPPEAGAPAALRASVDTVPDGARMLPLGTPVSGVSVGVVIPGTVSPAPLGMPGELVVNGTRVARARRTANGALELLDTATHGSPPFTPERPLAEPDAQVRRWVGGGAESATAAAWRDVLGTSGFGPDDNFFDAGGNSLLLLRLQKALRDRTGASVTVADLFRHTTVRAQSMLLGAQGEATRHSSALPLAVAGTLDTDQGIAVIGLACRFAGSPDKDAFWQNLVAGKDLITTSSLQGAPDLPGGARRVPRWGLLADGIGYDARMLGFSANEMLSADPRHGIFYECLWAAVEDAALKISDIGPRTALYAGKDRWDERIDQGSPESPARADDVVGVSATFMPSRFSYWNDLWGESILLDTACSTSLVAVHLACASLRRGDSDYALAGGVSIENPSDGSYVHVPGHIYARDGICRPFDQAATGTVGGDGAGAVLLRRLSDAVRDGDPVYAVIRGSAVNNDGRGRIGYTAPGIEGQARVIRRALGAAGMTGEEIGFVEPHGTGTRLGDAIEALALTDALGPQGPPVTLGGVKASIGHTNSAAGVAGLIKTVLAVHHGYLPATPNVSEPVEELRENGGRLTLLTRGMEWGGHRRPRTAGVSSFGVGGTNAHVVVQQFLHDAREGSATRI